MLGLTLAVALHSQPYGENGLLVTLYSPKEGLMRGIARGSRTPGGRQRYSALLHPMALVELQYKAARREEGLYTLHDAEAQCALTVMLNEPKRMFVALFCSEVLLLLLRNAPGNLETYELAKGLVLALNDAEKGVAWLPTWFLLRLACVLGYAPSG